MIIPCCSRYQNIVPFYGWIVFHWMYIPHLSVHLLMDSCYHLLAIENNVSMNRGLQICGSLVFSSFGHIPRSGIAESYDINIFSFLRDVQTFSYWQYRFIFHWQCLGIPVFTIVTSSLNNSHPTKCEVVVGFFDKYFLTNFSSRVDHCSWRFDFSWNPIWLKLLFLLTGISKISVMSVKSNGTVLALSSLKWRSEMGSCSVVSDPWHAMDLAYQAPLSMGFPRQEYWSGLPFPSPGDLPGPGIEARSPALQAGSLLFEPSGKPIIVYLFIKEGKSQPLDDSFNKIRLRFCILSYTICHTWRKGVFWRSQ